jgi:ankyrin repeat protein
MFICSGADINLRNILEQSPLFVASQQGRCNVVKCLLSSGADINLSDKFGQSPLSVEHHNNDAAMLLNVYFVLVQI